MNSVLTALKPLFNWFWDSVLQPLAQWTGGIFLTVWDGINKALKAFSDWCANNPGTIQNIAVIIGSFFAAWKIASFVQQAAGFITTAFNIVTSVKSVAGAFSLVKAGIGAVTTALGGPLVIGIGAAIAAGVLLYKNWDTICKWATKLKNWVVDKTRGLRDGAVNAFNTLTTNCSNAIHVLYTSVTSKWNAIKEKFNTFRNWLASVFQTDWSKRFGVLGNILNAFLASVKTRVQGIKNIFNGLITFIRGVFSGNWRQAWNGIKQIFVGVFQGLTGLARTPVNAIISGFNAVLGTVNGLINKINGISFKIEVPKWIPGIGGASWGFNGFSIPTIGSIPFLAQGGYVKPNTPQLAMIGDNRHQGEVVAPEDKLLEMARAAAELSGGDSEKTEKLIQELIDLIKNLPIVELDPEAIRKYFIKKTNQNTKATGKPELLY